MCMCVCVAWKQTFAYPFMQPSISILDTHKHRQRGIHHLCIWVYGYILVIACVSMGPHGPLLAAVKRWKLAWFRHVTVLLHTTTASPKPSFRAPWRWAIPWSAEEMLGGQHHRVDIPAHARFAHKASCRKDWKITSVELSLMSQFKGLSWT